MTSSTLCASLISLMTRPMSRPSGAVSSNITPLFLMSGKDVERIISPTHADAMLSQYINPVFIYTTADMMTKKLLKASPSKCMNTPKAFRSLSFCFRGRVGDSCS